MAEIKRGCYILVIFLEKEEHIRVGALGGINFSPGHYYYVGSAMNGLSQRISRHKRKHKNKHWHIDYLLEYGEIADALIFETSESNSEKGLRKRLSTFIARSGQGAVHNQINIRTECLIAMTLTAIPGISATVPRFGSSDCRCAAHLFHGNVNETRLIKNFFRGIAGREKK